MKKLSLLLIGSWLTAQLLFGQSAWTPTVAGGRSAGSQFSNPPVNPKDYGAIADGVSHPITASDIASNASKWRGRIARTVTDAVISSGSGTVTSATANFKACDKGAQIVSSSFPAYTFIKTVNSSTSVSLNVAAGSSASGVTITLQGYAAGDQWDYVGLQEAFLVAFGGPSTTTTRAPNSNWTEMHGNLNSSKNAAVHIPGGSYSLNKPIISGVTGYRIYGDGKNATALHQFGAQQAIFLFDGVAYGSIENMAFYGNAANTTMPLLAYEWAGISGALQPQQNTVYSCAFYGNFTTDVGVDIASYSATSSGRQGDTFLFNNCYFAQFNFAALRTSSYNALGIIVHGGNFQSNSLYGIWSNTSQVIVDGTSFQAGVDLRTTIRKKACDFMQNAPGANAPSTMRNVRSESWCLSRNVPVVESCWSLPAGPPQWQARHAYNVGDIIQARTFININGIGAGRIFICTVAGTSGSSDPNWDSLTVYGLDEGGDISSGNTTLTLHATNRDNTTDFTQAGMAYIVHGAGVAGADLFAHSNRFQTGTPTMDTAASTTVTGATVVWGNQVTDGTAKWADYDYYSCVDPTILRNSTFYYGKVHQRSLPGAVAEGNCMSRRDYFPQWARSLTALNVRNAMYDIGNAVQSGTVGSWDNKYYSFGGSLYNVKRDFASGPIVFSREDYPGSGGSHAPDIGFVRADSSSSALATATGDTRNMIGVVGTLGAPLVAGTNVTGRDLKISGGPGTGSGGGGAIRFYTQAAGTSGTSVPDNTQRMSIDNIGRVNINKTMRLVPGAFSTAVASPLEGDMQYFTDSNTNTHGATIAAGGTNHVVGLYNGTAWVVFFP
jgi:hypothetical protein